MKKLFQIAIFFFIASIANAQTKDTSKVQKPQTFTVSGSLETFQRLLDVLDNSTAPHTDVKALEQWVYSQIQKQIPQASGTKK